MSKPSRYPLINREKMTLIKWKKERSNQKGCNGVTSISHQEQILRASSSQANCARLADDVQEEAQVTDRLFNATAKHSTTSNHQVRWKATKDDKQTAAGDCFFAMWDLEPKFSAHLCSKSYGLRRTSKETEYQMFHFDFSFSPLNYKK